ncbi:MAG: BTAD domain-containing putative transcriptional regulator [Actinomycetota bacterium]
MALPTGRSLARLMSVVAALIFVESWMGPSVAGGAEPQAAGIAASEASAPPAPGRAPDRSIGALLTTNSPGWSAVLKTNNAPGVLVLGVLHGTGVATGLEQGDVITSVNGTKLSGEEQLSVIFRKGASGRHKLSFIKPSGKTGRASITLAPRKLLGIPAFVRQQYSSRDDPITRFLFAQSTPSSNLSIALSKALTLESPEFPRAHALLARGLADRFTAATNQTLTPDARAALKRDAIAEVKRSVELDPGAAKIHEIAAGIFLSVGETRQAEAQAVAAIAADPQAGRAHNMLGRVRLTLGRPADAVGPLRHAISLDPFVPHFYRLLARAYSATGKTSESDRTLESLRSLEQSITQSAAAPAAEPAAETKVKPSVALSALAVIVVGFALTRFRRIYEPFQGAPEVHPAGGLTQTLGLEALAGTALFSLAISIPYLGGFFGLQAAQAERIELIGHLIPGALLLAIALYALTRWPDVATTMPTVVPVAGLLLGIWMSATQVRLLRQALSGFTTWPKVALHFAPGLAALAFAGWLYWAVNAERQERTPAKKTSV